MKVIRLQLGLMEANCYLVFDQESKDTLIIDPGDEADFIESVIIRELLNPIAIIATHGHFDHMAAAAELKLAYGVAFMANKKDESLIKRAHFSAKHFAGLFQQTVPGVDKYLVKGDRIKVGALSLSVLETPGHTPGSICLWEKSAKMLFAGDLMFAGGEIGRADFNYSDKSKLLKSIQRVLRISRDTRVYPGHGPEFNLKDWPTAALNQLSNLISLEKL